MKELQAEWQALSADERKKYVSVGEEQRKEASIRKGMRLVTEKDIKNDIAATQASLGKAVCDFYHGDSWCSDRKRCI
jgi:hypothetical protein